LNTNNNTGNNTTNIHRPIAITGLGVVSPVGNNIAQFEQALLAGTNGITKNNFQDTEGYTSKVCGQVKNLELSDDINQYLGRKGSDLEKFVLSATEQAWQQANLDQVADINERTGVILGSGGSIHGLECFIKNKVEQANNAPSILLNYSPDTAGTAVANYYKLHGPRSSIMTACSSGATAIGFAADMIRTGFADVMVTGGVESLSTVTISGFNSLGAMSETTPKPFDAERDGIALGEGAGILILEDLEHAQKRGANILAIFEGYGFTGDGHHMTAPHPEGEGMIRAMQSALKEANLTTTDINYINAHGTGTKLNDKSESAAVSQLFGAHAQNISMSSTKSMIGHTLSAAGAIEAVASCLAVKGQFAPPTINYKTPDENCTIDPVPNVAKPMNLDYVMSNSLAFAGNNTSLIFSKAS